MHSHFQFFLRGYLGLWENLGWGTLFSCFIAFLWSNFSKSSEGVHEVSPPPLPLCAPMEKRQMILERTVFLIFRRNLIMFFFLTNVIVFSSFEQKWSYSNKSDLIRTKVISFEQKWRPFFIRLIFPQYLNPDRSLISKMQRNVKRFFFLFKQKSKKNEKR